MDAPHSPTSAGPPQPVDDNRGATAAPATDPPATAPALDRCWTEVRRFHEVFNHPIGARPTLLTPDRVDKRSGWMLEELREFQDAADVTDQADAMIDLIYFALGTLVEMGVRPDALFDIVQAANMSKLWEDGRPRYDATGKVIKPHSFRAPEPLLRAAIARMEAE